jgi:hypothetical protein
VHAERRTSTQHGLASCHRLSGAGVRFDWIERLYIDPERQSVIATITTVEYENQHAQTAEAA